MSTFRTVAVFSFPAQAAVIKGKLESENIHVILRDEFTIATDPFATTALGGVKMDVYKEDYIKALGIIELHAPDSVQVDVSALRCPICDKRGVREQQDLDTAHTFKQRLRAAILSIFPFKNDLPYQCTHCNHIFNTTHE